MHRTAFVLLLLIPLVAPVGAQPEGQPEALLEVDPAGDVVLTTPAGGPSTSVDQPMHDLRGIAVEKGTEGILFSMQTEDTEALYNQDGVIGGDFVIRFLFHDVEYQLDFHETFEGHACLDRTVPGSDVQDFVGCFDSTLDGDWIRVDIPSDDVLDGRGAPLRHPAQLSQVYAYSAANVTGFWTEDTGATRISDRAPEDGWWPGLETPADEGAGPVVITPERSVRSSNGGPDLFVYRLTMDNIVDEPVPLEVAVRDLPDGWEHRVAPSVLVPLDGATLPVVISTPSAHTHGDLVEFTVVATTTDATEIEAPLAVKFLDVPQPAGHHPDVFAHSGTYAQSSADRMWLSTLEEEAEAHDEPVSSSQSILDAGWTRLWAFRVGILSLGLDFDLEQDITGTIAIRSESTNQVEELKASLMYCHPNDASGDWATMFFCDGSWFSLASQDLDVSELGGDVTYDFLQPPAEMADSIPYRWLADLALIIEARSPASELRGIQVDPTATKLHLPLFEFRDEPEAFEAASDLSMHEVSPSSVTLAPGGSNWVEFEIINDGPAKTLEIGLTGTNADWITAHADQVDVPSRGTASAFFHIQVPSNMPAGARASVAVIAEDADDPSNVALNFIEATVGEEATESWPGPSQDSGEEAPLSPAIMLTALLLGLSLRRPPRSTHRRSDT